MGNILSEYKPIKKTSKLNKKFNLKKIHDLYVKNQSFGYGTSPSEEKIKMILMNHYKLEGKLPEMLQILISIYLGLEKENSIIKDKLFYKNKSLKQAYGSKLEEIKKNIEKQIRYCEVLTKNGSKLTKTDIYNLNKIIGIKINYRISSNDSWFTQSSILMKIISDLRYDVSKIDKEIIVLKKI